MPSAPITVLLVEDNPGDIRLLQEALREAGIAIHLHYAQRLLEALTRLSQGGIDIILLDLTLPDGQGLDTLRRAHAAAPGVPIVVLTGLNDEALAIQAVQYGAQDYLVKGTTDGNLLVRAMRYAIERKRSEDNARTLYREQAARAEAEAAEQYYRFLAEASRVLGSQLDYESTLPVVAQLCVPLLADACTIDVLDDEGSPHRLAEAPPAATEKMPAALTLPLLARGRTLGTLTLLSHGARSREQKTLAGELASRIALAVDNTRLYREAQQAAGARDQVLAVVSHDLRNPLTVISMVAEHLSREMDMPGGQRQKYIEQIQRSAWRMNRLIQDILDVTKLEAGRLALERQRHEVAPLSAEALEMVRPQAAEKDITLSGAAMPAPGSRSLESSGAAPEQVHDLHILADRDRVLQVFSNLLGNAVKFTPRGGRIQLRVDESPGEVCFSVQDSGPGIKEEDLAHIFDRFWQAKRTARQGTGLGLAIAKGIVEAHGGKIWVRSQPDQGSTFFFTLPRA